MKIAGVFVLGLIAGTLLAAAAQAWAGNDRDAPAVRLTSMTVTCVDGIRRTGFERNTPCLKWRLEPAP